MSTRYRVGESASWVVAVGSKTVCIPTQRLAAEGEPDAVACFCPAVLRLPFRADQHHPSRSMRPVFHGLGSGWGSRLVVADRPVPTS